MSIPKSKKLRAEEADHGSPLPSMAVRDNVVQSGPIQIREIPCCNDIVAVLRFQFESVVALPEASQHRDEGIVVGVGPGIPANDGRRCPSQFQLGDVVMFRAKDVITNVQSSSGCYQGKEVVLLSERSFLCKLRPVPFEVIT